MGSTFTGALKLCAGYSQPHTPDHHKHDDNQRSHRDDNVPFVDLQDIREDLRLTA